MSKARLIESMKRRSSLHRWKKRGSGLVALAVVLFLLGAISLGQNKSVEIKLAEPFTMRDDFQGDSLGQWASYPPPQDIGYEPSLSPTADFDARGGRSLMRVVRPNHRGPLRFGFIKRLNMVMAEGARLSLAYQLRSPSSNDLIEIGLAGQDGHRYTTKGPAVADRWTNLEVKLAELRDEKGQGPVAGLEIEAIYLVANFAHANPDLAYRFILDDVALSAARDARFEVRMPEAVEVAPWRALNSVVGYRSGETISIKATAPARLARVECALMGQDEPIVSSGRLYDDGTHGDERAGDGVWSNDSIYTFRATDIPGLWMAELKGITSDGRSISTFFRFVVHPSGASAHPRLLFGAIDREALVARTSDPKTAALWAKLQTAVKNTRETGNLAHGGEAFTRLDNVYLLPTLLGYFDVLSRARARIASNAFDAYLTGDPQSLGTAKSAVLDVARWKTWIPPWFEAHGQHTYYPAGELAFDMAFAYDLLYDKLSDDERALVRRALIERAIIPTYEEYVVDNRAMASTSNWIAHTVGGALLAAAAIAGDGPPAESNGRLELYTNGLLQKLESHIAASYLPDGSYGEGISYQEFDLESLGPAFTALHRVFGVDYWKHSEVLGSLTYPLYTLAKPTTESLDMGDSHPPSGRTIAPLVKKSGDPMLRWYYDQFEHSSIIDFIFFDDSVAPRAPSLPTSRLFADKGNAVLRSGWGPEDFVFLYRAGPTFNHNHNDQGSFLLTAFGENLISEGGWSDYYKDPYYTTFFTQAVGHNTVLVDGNPESQGIADTRQFAALNTYPRITDAITSEFYDALGSDLTAVYQDRLDRYTRRIVFVKPHYFVIYDDLSAKGAPATFAWLLHLPDRTRINTSPGLTLYGGNRAALAVRTFAPVDAELQVRDGHIPYPVFAVSTPKTVPPQPAFLDVRTTAPATSAQFLVALVPARSATEAQALAGRMTEIKGDGWIGLRTERGTEGDLVMFRVGATNGAWRYEEWMTDAVAWTITQREEALRMFAVQNARSFTRGGRALFASDNAVSIAANYNANAIEVACYAASQAKIQLFVGARPVRVLLDVREVSGRYDPGGTTISLTVPAGQHQLKIALK
jgi:hypothetical protein